MRGLWLLLFLAACASRSPTPPSPAVSAPTALTPRLATTPPYALAETEVHILESAITGRRYELMIAWPTRYEAEPQRRFPVLFVTDAPYAFPLVRAIRSRLVRADPPIEDFILVGLGYAVGETAQHSRRRDYTPTPDGDIDAVSDMPGRPVVYGGAETYRRHLKEEAIPFVLARTRADPAHLVYAGHSYGGLLGADMLLADPGMFSRWILLSPSLWYGGGVMLARARHANAPLSARLFLATGALETTPKPSPVPTADARHDLVGDQARFVAALRAKGGPQLDVTAGVLAGEDHMSVYPPAITRALRWAFPRP
ncbi:alpha/beta hydrolase [Thermaurantiacus sp.]